MNLLGVAFIFTTLVLLLHVVLVLAYKTVGWLVYLFIDSSNGCSKRAVNLI